MKYIAGTSLEDVLDEKKRLPVDYVQRVLWEAACALGHAHQRGIVHRDVKPANIMFDHDGRVMLTDFGISKALQAASGFTGTGMIIGTPHYMAPEQAKGSAVDGRADQYSLGVVGYRMLTLELPFGGDSVHTILYKHIFEPAPRTSSVRQDMPPHLSEAISRALAKEPAQRYANMEEFATAVWPEQPVAAPGSGKSTPRPRPKPAVTAESPTELTPAPTTPLPAVKGKAPPPVAKKKGGKGLFVGVAVLAVAAGGYFVMVKGGAKPPDNQPASQKPDTVTVPVQTTPAPVQTKTQGTPSPRRDQRRDAPPRQQAPAAAAGVVTIASDPQNAEVYIDGVDVGQTPIIEYSLSEGRHTIRVERAGYKTQTETVTVNANTPVRRRFTLIPE